MPWEDHLDVARIWESAGGQRISDQILWFAHVESNNISRKQNELHVTCYFLGSTDSNPPLPRISTPKMERGKQPHAPCSMAKPKLIESLSDHAPKMAQMRSESPRPVVRVVAHRLTDHCPAVSPFAKATERPRPRPIRPISGRRRKASSRRWRVPHDGDIDELLVEGGLCLLHFSFPSRLSKPVFLRQAKSCLAELCLWA